MAKSTNPIPPGFRTVTPYLIVRDARKAIDFYKKAFDAQEIMIMPGAGGKTMHAEIKIGDSIIFLADEFPQMNLLSPESRGGATSSLMLYVPNVDSCFDKAIKAGCTSILSPVDQFWGDRFSKLSDPFGHQWAIATHIEDVSPEEMKKRAEDFSKQMASAAKN